MGRWRRLWTGKSEKGGRLGPENYLNKARKVKLSGPCHRKASGEVGPGDWNLG